MSEIDDLESPAPRGTGRAAAAAEIGEVNEADAAEQGALPDEDAQPGETALLEENARLDEGEPLDELAPSRAWYARIPDDVNEADAVEQRFEVPLDEDDYDR